MEGKTLSAFGKTVVFVLLLSIMGLSAGSVCFAMESKAPALMHPIMQPQQVTDKVTCENCGMNRNMWARTRHSFANTGGEHYTCSIHCLADISHKAGTAPEQVNVALYLEPAKEIAATDAYYVVGSSAAGTMTMNSKLAFADQAAADAFVAENGGEIMRFDAALAKATAQLDMAYEKIAANRIKKGKVKIPGETEGCAVCGMYPARYPQHRAQILTKEKQTMHFCSTSCLSKYMAHPDKFTESKPAAMATWVTVFQDGGYEYANGLYYVVGSKVMGSMGPEGLPFRKKETAEKFAAENGGEVIPFALLTPEKIGAGKMGMHHMK